MSTPTRERAWTLLNTYTQSERLVAHGLAVEATMRYFAERLAFDPDMWGTIGLIHDLDWERWPEEHCARTTQILRDDGWPEEWIRAVRSHAWGMFTDDEPIHPMEKVLYTIDELTGLVAAAALVRPSKSILDLSVKSVKKKWKEKSFAAGANREVIERGAEMVGMELAEIIDWTIEGMRRAAADLGLAGTGEGATHE